jgi:hypothetical protein
LTTPGIAVSARTTSLPVPGIRWSSLRSSTAAPGAAAGASAVISMVSAWLPALSITTSSSLVALTLASAGSKPSRSITRLAPIAAVISNWPPRSVLAVSVPPSTLTVAPATGRPSASITRPVIAVTGSSALGTVGGCAGGGDPGVGSCASAAPDHAASAVKNIMERRNTAGYPRAPRSFIVSFIVVPGRSARPSRAKQRPCRAGRIPA